MMHSYIVAFPLFLQTHYIRNIAVVLKVSCFNFYFIRKAAPSLVVFRMTHVYIYVCEFVHVSYCSRKTQGHLFFKNKMGGGGGFFIEIFFILLEVSLNPTFCIFAWYFGRVYCIIKQKVKNIFSIQKLLQINESALTELICL